MAEPVLPSYRQNAHGSAALTCESQVTHCHILQTFSREPSERRRVRTHCKVPPVAYVPSPLRYLSPDRPRRVYGTTDPPKTCAIWPDMMAKFDSSFETDIGRIQGIFYGIPPSDQEPFKGRFVARTLGPYSTTEHLKNVKESRSVVLEWHEVLLACIRGVHKLAPTICARHAFVTQVAVYDAWAAYNDNIKAVYSMEKAKPSKVPSADHLEKSISFAAFATLSVLFRSARLDEKNAQPQHATDHLKKYLQAKYPNAKLEALKVWTRPDLDLAVGNSNLGLEESMMLGLRVARDVLKARENDGSNQDNDYTDLTHYPSNLFPKGLDDKEPYPNEPLKVRGFEPASGAIHNKDFWQQLDVAGNDPTVQMAATPHWGKVTGFAMSTTPATDGWTTGETNDILGAGNFPDYKQGNPTSAYKVIVDEVLAYSAALNDKNKVIADYWADYNHSNLPPGHWCALTVRLMYERQYTTDQAVQLLFVLTAALFDSSIACWSGKYLFNKPRPITAANVYPEELSCVYTFKKKDAIQIVPNKIWRPFQPAGLVSPNFPAYPSGHSTFGAAFATVMRNFTDSQTFKASVVVPGGSLPSDMSYGIASPATEMVLYWETYEEASQENGISRLYNGVHYQPDNVYGMEVGRRVGEKVWAKAFSYFERAYEKPSQGASGKRDQGGVGDGARKGDVSVNGNQDAKQSRAAQISQTFQGAAQQAFS